MSVLILTLIFSLIGMTVLFRGGCNNYFCTAFYVRDGIVIGHSEIQAYLHGGGFQKIECVYGINISYKYRIHGKENLCSIGTKHYKDINKLNELINKNPIGSKRELFIDKSNEDCNINEEIKTNETIGIIFICLSFYFLIYAIFFEKCVNKKKI